MIREPAPDADKKEEDDKLPAAAVEPVGAAQRKPMKRLPTVPAVKDKDKEKPEKPEKKDKVKDEGAPKTGDAAVDVDVLAAVGTA